MPDGDFELIYRKYYRRVYLFLLKLCGNHELSEDLTQETFYQAFLSIHRFKGRSDVFTFIAAIAKHTYLKYLRKNRNSVCEAYIGELRSDFSDPEYIYEKSVEKMNIRDLVEKLPERYRDVILFRVYAEMTFGQIAEAMGITENSAKVIFFRAKKKLTEDLKNGDYL